MQGTPGTPDADQLLKRLAVLEQFAVTLASVGAAPDLESALEALLRGAMSLLDGDDGVARIFDPETGESELLVYIGRDGAIDTRRQPGPPPEGSLAAAIQAGGPPVLVEDFTSLDPTAYPLYQQRTHRHLRSAVVVPIDAGRRRIGCLQVDHHRPAFFGPTELAIAGGLAAQAGAAIERARVDAERREALAALAASERRLQRANARLRRLSSRDALTGLANRRALNQHLAREWRRASRLRVPLAVVMLDLDHFKAFNDRYGHQAGDACLRTVGRALAGAARRAGDLAARYGGEEFALVLGDTDAGGARTIAEEARRRVAAQGITHPTVGGASHVTHVTQVTHVTLSAGVASAVPDSSASPATLVARADAALYRAKQQGRDRVVVDDSPHDAPLDGAPAPLTLP